LTVKIYQTEKYYRQDFARDLIETQDIIQIIIDDLKDYVDYLNSLIASKKATVEQLKDMEHSDPHMFSHSKNIKTRIKRIK
jgi:hypothetical protein